MTNCLIRDLRSGMNNVNLVALVVDLTDQVIINNKLHSQATLEDHTGYVTLNLWRNQVNQVKVGDVIEVSKGFTRTWKNKIEISTWEDISLLNTK